MEMDQDELEIKSRGRGAFDPPPRQITLQQKTTKCV